MNNLLIYINKNIVLRNKKDKLKRLIDERKRSSLNKNVKHLKLFSFFFVLIFQ